MFINDEAQRQVLPVIARSTVTAVSESQQRNGEMLQLNPGQQVKAEIIANLPNSLFLARIAGQLYKLEIPLNVQPGETVDLTFVTAEPRLTFQMTAQDPAGTSVNLSTIGKWLASIAEQGAPVATLREPLLETPAQGSALLAARLQDAVVQSGLFYESHLAQWAAGGMQLKEIVREPQGKLSKAASRKERPEGGDNSMEGFADHSTVPLIKEQLHLLHGGTFTWRGEAWPGQGMELCVTEGEADQERSGIEAMLSLELPHLGGVAAQVMLAPEGLHLEFVCQRAGSAAALRDGGNELRQGLASSGLHLAAMAVKDAETAE